MSETLPMPFDVRLMNVVSGLLFLGFCAFAILMTSRWALRYPAFDFDRITIAGDVVHNNAVTLRANVAPRLRGNFFTLDLLEAKQAFEAVSWVRRANVRRDFPNRLKVTLEEHQPVAYWGDSGDSTLLNSFGEVFDANTGDIERDDLPALHAPSATQAPQVLDMYQRLKPMFLSHDLTIERLSLSGRGGWRVELDTDAVIELGRGEAPEVLPRVEQFVKTLTQVTAKYGRKADAVESADLRHGDGYAVRLRGVTTLSADSPGKQQKR